MPRSCEVCKALCAPPIYFPHPEDETVFRKMECEGIDSGRGKPGWFFKARLGLCYNLLGKLSAGRDTGSFAFCPLYKEQG